jgi:hypothetical protein
MFAETTMDFLKPNWQTVHCYPGSWSFRFFSANCSPDRGWRVNSLLRTGSRQQASPLVNDIRDD